jgi:hypothetical protein
LNCAFNQRKIFSFCSKWHGKNNNSIICWKAKIHKLL